MPAVSTRPILQTFVSSNKADMFKCHSITPDTYFTPPYACAYSNSEILTLLHTFFNPKLLSIGARTGGAPHLAVATEEGSVCILDTSKRRDWDYGAQRSL